MTLGEDVVRGFLSTYKYGTMVLQHRQHQLRIDVSRVYAAKHGNLQAPKFCVPHQRLGVGGVDQQSDYRPQEGPPAGSAQQGQCCAAGADPFELAKEGPVGTWLQTGAAVRCRV